MMLQQVLNKLSSKPKTLFLIDGLGAVLSTFSLGVILVAFEDLFGMPKKTLYYLSSIALLFAIYSLSCFFRMPQNWKLFLKIIAFANLIYCFTTLVLVFYFHEALTELGFLYFFGELVILIILISVELKIATNNNSTLSPKN